MSDLTAPHAVDTDSLTGQLAAVRHAVLALGSNLGDRLETLQATVDSLAETPGVVLSAASPVYATDPVGGPSDSPEFLNAVVLVETTLSPETLLERSLALEDAFGRLREERWGPRTLDIDILVVGDLVVNRTAEGGPSLQVPHPRLAERAFVLAPWADLEPDAQVPGLGTVRELLARVDTSGVRRTDDELVVDA
jgi:2-amino-4-hydroxy-6-hydroxymethyldihydropteridine diphosphokinase